MHMVKNADLHEDVMDEIWQRLPVKSLVRFKCVCKSWGASFRRPDFIKAHHRTQVAIDNAEFMPSKLFLKRNKTEGEAFFTSLELTIDEEDNVTVKDKENIFLPFLFRRFESSLRLKYKDFPLNAYVFGHCNGIICLTRFDDVVLWNPATREIKFLQSCPLMPGIGSNSFVTAFGYDPINDDYKILKTIWKAHRYDGVQGASYKVHHVLYSLKRNEWKLLHGDYDWFGTPEDNLCIDGVYHIQCGTELLLSLDLTNEVFIATDFPSCIFTFGLIQLTPGDEDNCIGMVRYEDISGFFEVWTLKELGVKESWTKLRTIGPMKGVTLFFGFWKKKILLELNKEEIAVYDIENGKLQILGFAPIPDIEACFFDGGYRSLRPNPYMDDQFIHYVESLVSFGTSGDCEEDQGVLRLLF